jgi:hypothetical protein
MRGSVDRTAEETLAMLLQNAVRTESGCLICHLAPTQKGYSSVYVGGKREYAHRFVYRMLKGVIPAGKMVCHNCDTRRCIEVEHLFAGTAQQNTDDMMSKGRYRQGYTRKVGKELLAKILEMRAQGASHLQIAVMFDLSKTCIATNLRRAKNVASE